MGIISTLNKRSDCHESCEDNFFIYEDPYHIVGVIADGCSTGIKSSFASQLFCYLFENYKIHDITSDIIISEVCEDLKEIVVKLNLSTNQLWATLVLFKYHISTKQLTIRILGDGCYYVNNQEFIVDQANKVHYIIDNLNDLQEYLDKYQEITYDNVDNFRISSDGILSYQLPSFKNSEKIPKDFLLTPNLSANHLDRKYNILKKEGWINKDDLTIISYDSL